MSEFFFKPISAADYLDIGHDQCGGWVARDRDGIKGGSFFTYEGAMRFARSEAGAYIHLSAAGESNGRWRASDPSNEGRVS